MKRTNQCPGAPDNPTTVWGTVEVDDSPNLIKRYNHLFDFDNHQMTIAELESKTQPAGHHLSPQLIIQMTAPGRPGRGDSSVDST